MGRRAREYALWQKMQALLIVRKQEELDKKREELGQTRTNKVALLDAREEESRKLQQEESEQKAEVQQLNKKEKDLRQKLAQKRRQAEALNRQIEKLIAEEVKRSGKASSGKRKAESNGGYAMTKAERKLSADFASNRGRLPFPLNGKYRIISTFGEHQHQALRHVRTNNNGIDIQTTSGTVEFGITNVQVCGDTRFDRVLAVQRQARELPAVKEFAGDGTSLILVAGSSWPEDESILIPYFNTHPEVKLIIAPHEIPREHLLYIESLLHRPSIRLSETNDQPVSGKDCLIIDSFGLLSSIYRYGEVAYVGGGFGKGIHNTLEAAVYGIPVLFGPRYQKFREAHELIACGGGFSLQNEAAFIIRMDEFIRNPAQRAKAGQIVGDYVRRNSGVTDRILGEMRL